jgi:hypothetical protein
MKTPISVPRFALFACRQAISQVTSERKHISEKLEILVCLSLNVLYLKSPFFTLLISFPGFGIYTTNYLEKRLLGRILPLLFHRDCDLPLRSVWCLWCVWLLPSHTAISLKRNAITSLRPFQSTKQYSNSSPLGHPRSPTRNWEGKRKRKKV